MTRFDGHQLSPATALRIMRRRGLILAADYQRERRQLAAARRAVFVDSPTGPNQVWQLDFSEFETVGGGTWRIAACTDYWSKYELGWHMSLTANQHDAIAAVDAAIREAELLAGRPLIEALTDPQTRASARAHQRRRVAQLQSAMSGSSLRSDAWSLLILKAPTPSTPRRHAVTQPANHAQIRRADKPWPGTYLPAQPHEQRSRPSIASITIDLSRHEVYP